MKELDGKSYAIGAIVGISSYAICREAIPYFEERIKNRYYHKTIKAYTKLVNRLDSKKFKERIIALEEDRYKLFVSYPINITKIMLEVYEIKGDSKLSEKEKRIEYKNKYENMVNIIEEMNSEFEIEFEGL